MMIQRILGCTRVLGQSQGYLGLPVRDVVYADGVRAIVTAWEPTPAELEALNRGEKVHLLMMCVTPPPVKLTVGLPEEIPPVE